MWMLYRLARLPTRGSLFFVSPTLVVPVIGLVIVVGIAFVIGRVRIGQWGARRDGVVIAAIALMGIAALLLALLPPGVALFGAPLALIVGGLYLVANQRASDD